MRGLSGKNVLVTGGASGIGQATATRFLEEGCAVCVLDRSTEARTRVARELPGLTGVIDADVGLNLPDFRASERTFQILSQVAGRAGRGSIQGKVYVQTAKPAHFAIQTALQHDFETFATRELDDRAGPGYPPHIRLANLVITGTHETTVADAADALGDWLEGLIERKGVTSTTVLGPAPCPIDRLRGRWRWHLLLKSDDPLALGSILRFAATNAPIPSGLRLEIDRDPENLL